MRDCGDYVISCNTTRHSKAGLQFNAYVEAVIDGLEPAVKKIAQLAGHHQQTQLRLNNDNFAHACVKAYQKLKQFADDEATRFKDDEIFPHGVVIPFAAANQLCKLLWAAHHDAFRRGGTVVLMLEMLESLIPARQATVLVLGRTIQVDEPRTFSSCVAYELRCESGDIGRCFPVARSLARWDVTISDEWRGANVQHLPVEDKNKWNYLLYKADCTIADVLKILLEQPWQL
ncbi:unnamed protein product [Heligmosomoides polygyrus]|uniref:PAP-associated domain-containing protein n=1 Tax=Heligmosomoides polygyrus TaxID=6339 RepID=A0A183FYB1_HELPZ|nr:unnamed protein product [Heligmosomoides polygyrus]